MNAEQLDRRNSERRRAERRFGTDRRQRASSSWPLTHRKFVKEMTKTSKSASLELETFRDAMAELRLSLDILRERNRNRVPKQRTGSVGNSPSASLNLKGTDI